MCGGQTALVRVLKCSVSGGAGADQELKPHSVAIFSKLAPIRKDSSASVSRSTLFTSSTAGTGAPPLKTTFESISAFHCATASSVDCRVTSHTTTAPTAFL